MKPSATKNTLFRFTGREKQEVITALTLLLQEERSIQFAYLYGSFLDELPCHDIDIGVYLHGPASPEMGLLAAELGGRLQRKVNCPVDVRVLNNAPVSFLFQVLKGRLLQKNNPDLHDNIFERTISRYLDMKPLLLGATKEAFADA